MTIVIGIVGGVASGKSLVSQFFQQQGAVVIDADRLGHEVLREKEVIDALCQRWGNVIVDEDGQIDRSKVAKIVFAPPPDGPRELAFLESVSHPRIKALIREKIDELAATQVKTVVLEAALLLEAGWDDACNAIVFVDAPLSLRQERAISRGWSPEHFDARQSAQLAVETKKRRADYCIDNSGDRENTARQVEQIWQSLLSSSPPKE